MNKEWKRKKLMYKEKESPSTMMEFPSALLNCPIDFWKQVRCWTYLEISLKSANQTELLPKFFQIPSPKTFLKSAITNQNCSQKNSRFPSLLKPSKVGCKTEFGS